MTDHIDPMDYLEAALDESEDNPDSLWAIDSELRRLGREATSQTLALLIDEDDRDERVRLVDLHVMRTGQLLKAHEEFVAHLKMILVLRQINPRPLKDW